MNLGNFPTDSETGTLCIDIKTFELNFQLNFGIPEKLDSGRMDSGRLDSAQVFSEYSPQPVKFNSVKSNESLSFFAFEIEGIDKIIKTLDPKKSNGHGMFSIRVLKL